MKENILGVALVKEVCPICTRQMDGPIIMNTRLSEKNAKEVESLHGKTVGFSEEPCSECKEMKEKGFILIGVVEAKTDDKKNPYRSGNIWVITHDYANKLFNNTPPDKGVAFIDVIAADKVGLPDSKLDA